MIDLNDDWQLELDDSPEWLFFHLPAPFRHATGEPAFAEIIAREASRTGIWRVVFDVADEVMLFGAMIGQFVSLQTRMLLEGGVFRECGLSREKEDSLRALHLSDRLPNDADREHVVMGRLEPRLSGTTSGSSNHV